MASLSELVSAADYLQRGKEKADPLYSGVQSFAGGLTSGADVTQDKSGKRLDRYVKIMEIQQKIQEAQRRAKEQAAAKKALQAAGILPLDPEDEAVAMQVANSKIGTEGIDPAAGTKTDAGKLNVLVNKAQQQTGVSPVEFDAAGTLNAYSSGKGGIKVKNKTVTGDSPTDRMRVRSLAENMARQSYAARIQKEGVNDPYGLNDAESMIKSYVPTIEDIAAFEPKAHEYLYGKKPDAPAPAAKKTATKKADPMDEVGDLDDVSSLWELLK